MTTMTIFEGKQRVGMRMDDVHGIVFETWGEVIPARGIHYDEKLGWVTSEGVPAEDFVTEQLFELLDEEPHVYDTPHMSKPGGVLGFPVDNGMLTELAKSFLAECKRIKTEKGLEGQSLDVSVDGDTVMNVPFNYSDSHIRDVALVFRDSIFGAQQ